ncbi:MAG: hypothetical protein KDC45_04235 [Bacteroidetes bacterium]|nr:hypothetical protein [Bacteroidota bacterium]
MDQVIKEVGAQIKILCEQQIIVPELPQKNIKVTEDVVAAIIIKALRYTNPNYFHLSIDLIRMRNKFLTEA